MVIWFSGKGKIEITSKLDGFSICFVEVSGS